MISYIKGTLVQLNNNSIVLECQGIGYEIFISSSWFDRLPPIDSELVVHTHMQVREDGISLYGFQSPREKSIYEWLISVNGVGPKAAMGILSTLDPDALSLAILTEDAKAIAKAPGIGLKTAKKVILELKDKMKDYDFLDSMEQEEEISSPAVTNGSVRLETIEAMKALGYSHTEAAKAVKQITFTENLSVEEAIKLALKAVL
jgi:Holliday junction DNA helicase RuvA